MPRKYITTAIDYPNTPPHVGHTLEKVLADVCARWFRLCGNEVRFQTGTDEHGIKLQRAAEKEGMAPEAFVHRNRQWFIEPYRKLQISYDEPFMHTAENAQHTQVVTQLWKKLAATKRKDGSAVLEKRGYTGLYCSGCERFLTKKDLIDGKCPDHNTVPEEITEENWFFTLSKDTAMLKELLKSSYVISPSWRANEVLALLDQGLEDVSFSRPRSSLSWGIPVPGDENQTMYVWCDALTNYISGINYFEDEKSRRKWWEGPDVEVTHVIGKDIARFHALIWPAMLHHVGIRTPDRLLIHGFMTSDGKKMSKTLGNVVTPEEVFEKYGVDALRFYLCHEIPVGNDGDFSWKRFGALYDAKLRNEVGNLLNRVIVLLKKEGGQLGAIGKGEFISVSHEPYRDAMNAFDMSGALQIALKIASDSNKYIDVSKPWTLKGEEKVSVLSTLAEGLRHLSLALLPFTPETAQKISLQLGVPYAAEILGKNFVITDEMKKWGGCREWKQVGEPSILFPPLI